MRTVVYSAAAYLPGAAPAQTPWRFDLASALIGAALALLLAGLVYRFRHAIRQSWQMRVTQPLTELLQRLQASAGDQYCALVVQWARSVTLLSPIAPVDAVFVEPRLLCPLPHDQSSPAAEGGLPPASTQVLPLRRILGQHHLLAISGAPGSGVTTLLAYVALTSARAVAQNAAVQATLGLTERWLPLCVTLSTMVWGEEEPDVAPESKSEPEGESGDKSELLLSMEQDEEEPDVAPDGEPDEERDDAGEGESEGEKKKEEKKEKERERGGRDGLISAAITAVGGNRPMVSVLRQYLEAGKAIVLVDGWDELAPEHRQRAAEWLSETIEATPGNVWLVGVGLQGCAPLTEIGFVPLKLSGWNVEQVETFAKQWGAVYTTSAGREVPPATLRQLTASLQHVVREEAPPLELALRAFVHLHEGQPPARRSLLFERVLELSLRQKEGKKEEEKEDWLLAACRTALERVAEALQQEGRTAVSRSRLDIIIGSALPSTDELPARAATRVFQALTGAWGLLRPAGLRRYSLAHPLWRAYLAARQLEGVDPASLVAHLDDPRWAEVVRFYAESGDMKPLLVAWVRRPDDIFLTRLRALSAWIKAAPQGSDWRDGTMALLARSFAKADLPIRLRQWLADALAATGVPGVTYLFKQALKHPDAGVRRVAVQGLTKIAEEADLPALELALSDQDASVRNAVVRGLAQVGTDAAIRWLARIVVEADEMISLEAANALAGCGEEGKQFLREAIESEDAIVRRGAVYGLARLGEREPLEKAAREDDQWIVRSAALAALEDLDKQKASSGIGPPPQVDQLPWLISWAAGQGEGVGLGEAARRMLWRALQEGDGPTRVAAARVLGQIGRLDDVEPLRAALATSDSDAVDAVLETLAEIGARYEIRIA